MKQQKYYIHCDECTKERPNERQETDPDAARLVPSESPKEPR